jgi:hypothetical protein
LVPISLSPYNWSWFYFCSSAANFFCDQAPPFRSNSLRQFLAGGLIDELHLAVRPVLLGSGEHLWKDIDVSALGYECVKSVASERATHVYLEKRGNKP